MGMLIEGVWLDEKREPPRTREGEFVRPDAAFRGRVTADGSSGFKAERGRYHLYVALACPWAHRTYIYRALKGLENVISLSQVASINTVEGWSFQGEGATPDAANGATWLHQVYTAAKPGFTGRVTVPVLWDKKTRTIVNNESSEIIRMLDREFDAFAEKRVPELYPAELRADIDRWNELIYRTVNNGVYRAGFATSQEKYERAVRDLFATLDLLEAHLARNRYLCGTRLTEADWRLFTTLVRFEPVYHFHFKCNLKRLRDYPNLWGYTRELYQVPGVAQTVDIAQIKLHYYGSQIRVNPSGVIAIGPVVDYDEPHGRERAGAT
jgi:glutathionyl-hydroquinone reductase